MSRAAVYRRHGRVACTTPLPRPLDEAELYVYAIFTYELIPEP